MEQNSLNNTATCFQKLKLSFHELKFFFLLFKFYSLDNRLFCSTPIFNMLAANRSNTAFLNKKVDELRRIDF